MAKRFISTELFNDEWFMALSLEGKLFWVYLITTCDHAGIFKPNHKLFFFQTGIKELPNTYLTLIKEIGNRLIPIEKGYYFIPKFIHFQYPKGLSASVKAQESVINILTLYKVYGNSYLTVQDKDIVKDKDLVKDKAEWFVFVNSEKVDCLDTYMTNNFQILYEAMQSQTKELFDPLIADFKKQSLEKSYSDKEEFRDHLRNYFNKRGEVLRKEMAKEAGKPKGITFDYGMHQA